METARQAFKTFENLECYRVARAFRKAMYAVSRRRSSSVARQSADLTI